jgi:hypothetical protein
MLHADLLLVAVCVAAVGLCAMRSILYNFTPVYVTGNSNTVKPGRESITAVNTLVPKIHYSLL